MVLGNHDVAVTRDPFSRSRELDALEGATLLRDEAVIVELRGHTVAIAGLDPVTYHRGGAKTACDKLSQSAEPLRCGSCSVTSRASSGGSGRARST